MLRKHYPTSSWLSTPWMLSRRRKRMVMMKLLFSFTMVTVIKIFMFTFFDQERTPWLSNVDVGSFQWLGRIHLFFLFLGTCCCCWWWWCRCMLLAIFTLSRSILAFEWIHYDRYPLIVSSWDLLFMSFAIKYRFPSIIGIHSPLYHLQRWLVNEWLALILGGPPSPIVSEDFAHLDNIGSRMIEPKNCPQHPQDQGSCSQL